MSAFHMYKRAAAAVLLLLLLAATLLACCVVDGARSMDEPAATKRSGYLVRPPAPAMRLYGGYLPRPKVIPPSGPSEGHNSIGPEMEQEDNNRLLRKP